MRARIDGLGGRVQIRRRDGQRSPGCRHWRRLRRSRGRLRQLGDYPRAKADLPAAPQRPVNLDQARRNLAAGLGLEILLLDQVLLDRINPVEVHRPARY